MSASCPRAVAILALTLLLGATPHTAAQAQPASVVSTDAAGHLGNGDSFLPAITPDGRYVVFETLAKNLAVPDVGNFRDIVLKDLQTGAVECISVDSNEVQATAHCFDPAISADARYVVFDSYAAALVPNDFNGFDDVFLRDRVAGTTTRISLTDTGTESGGDSSNAWITPDGRYVAFQSMGDLVPPWHPGSYNIYVRDLQTGTITLETHDADLQSGWGDSREPVLTPDARYLAFSSGSNELVPDDNNTSSDVFVRDRLLDTVERVSVDSLGVEHVKDSIEPCISDDGRYVAFVSYAFLDPADDNSDRDIYVRDRQLGITKLITPYSKGGIFDSPASWEPVISADGRWVVFQSDSFMLVPGDTNGFRDLFVHDLMHGITQRVTYDFAGGQTNEISLTPAITPDAHTIAFASKASDLVATDGNGKQDVFLMALGPWEDVGSALAGLSGAPALAGHGTLEAGASCDLTLTAAAPTAPSLLFVALTSAPVPFKGGQLVAFPFVAQAVLVTGGTGDLVLPFVWPAGVPASTHLDFQCAVKDAGAVAGVALSNALDALTP